MKKEPLTSERASEPLSRLPRRQASALILALGVALWAIFFLMVLAGLSQTSY